MYVSRFEFKYTVLSLFIHFNMTNIVISWFDKLCFVSGKFNKGFAFLLP